MPTFLQNGSFFFFLSHSLEEAEVIDISEHALIFDNDIRQMLGALGRRQKTIANKQTNRYDTKL